MKRPVQYCNAFTLVELMVVISIISMLIALLLPALGKARQTARLTQCSTQIRGFMSTSYQYASDYKSTLPSMNSGLVDSSIPYSDYSGNQPGLLAMKISAGTNGYHASNWLVGLGLIKNYEGTFSIQQHPVYPTAWGPIDTPMPIECVCPEDSQQEYPTHLLSQRTVKTTPIPIPMYSYTLSSYYNFMGLKTYVTTTNVDSAKRFQSNWHDRDKLDVDKPAKRAAMMCGWFHGPLSPGANIAGTNVHELAPIVFIDGHVGQGNMTAYAAMVKAGIGVYPISGFQWLNCTNKFATSDYGQDWIDGF